MIHHCPRCELRFRSDGELIEHLSLDHHVDASVFDPLRYPSRSQDPLYADLATPTRPTPRHYLVVANQTLHSPELEEEVLSRLELGPAEVVVLVPATHSADYPGGSTPVGQVRDQSDDRGLAQARWRLRKTVETLRAGGAIVNGLLGPADPYQAVAELVGKQRFDEIIMATLPSEASRWLAMDVPERIRRRLDVPVTVVSAGRPSLAATD